MNSQQEKLLIANTANLQKELTEKTLELELKNRELEIEACLERVRARAMAMQKSDELADAAQLLYHEFGNLGINTFSCGYMFIDEQKQTQTAWVVLPDGSLLSNFIVFPLTGDPVLNARYKDWQEKKPLHTFEIQGEANRQHHRFLSGHVPSFVVENIFSKIPDRIIFHCANFSDGYLLILATELFSPEDQQTIIRFAKVFEMTYTRFNDLKQAEAQAREAKIEAALERVRARTMGMHKSDELTEIAALLFKQVTDLGIKTWTTGFNVWSDDNIFYTDYITNPQGGFIEPYTIDSRQFHVFTQISEAKKRGDEFLVHHEEGEDLAETYRQLSKFGEKQFKAIQEIGFKFPEKQYVHIVFGSKVSLMFITYESLPEAHDIFKKFGKVFEQTYTRFLDLQKAETQTREAQIELGLERVRAKAIAMQKSDDLASAVAIIFEELEKLDIGILRCGIGILNKENRSVNVWTTSKSDENKPVQISGDESMDSHPLLQGAYNAWLKQKDYSYTLKGKDLTDYYKAQAAANFKLPGSQPLVESKEDICQYYFLSTFQAGGLFAFRETPFPDEAKKVMKRFASVFNLTYKRFLDLQKAEAQAREAQIELGLERVRARAMSMQKSDELKELIGTVFTELTKLDLVLTRCLIMIYDTKTLGITWWMANSEDPSNPAGLFVKYHQLAPHLAYIKAWRERELKWQYILEGEIKKEWDDFLFVETELSKLPDIVIAGMKAPERVYLNASFNSFGNLTLATLEPLSDEHADILLRFAKVFDLTYTRFNDLQKAEEQAREALIELALERVRSKAMAMHSSKDLSATITIFYRELESFNITPRRCGVGLLNKETRIAELSTMNIRPEGGSKELVGKLTMAGHPVLAGIYENWLLQKEYHPVLRGNEIKAYYQLLRPQISFPEYPNNAVQFGYFFFFPEGGVYAWTEKELTEDELKIYRRFTSVLSLTYKRYKDLRDAEARTLLAVRQSSLDRVRGEIASMRTAEHLQRITPLIWRELTALGVPFFRCGVFIINEQEEKTHLYLSTPGGESLAALHLDFNSSEITANAIQHWRTQKVYREHWNREQFVAWVQSLVGQKQIATPEAYQGGEAPPDSLTLQFVPFTQGMLYVGSIEPLNEMQIELVEALAQAFSIAYARYEDFNKLERAKEQIEKTLADLKQAQTQLIQSEKMASLGELTAGIAHEIQNPLNFVNNFSEVNKELIEELKTEKSKAGRDEQLENELLNDIAENEEKINHHGKRADAIVKGMLQHSRKSSGQKELTDINALADEYLRLSYHGLRAKDKNFNATVKTDFDESLSADKAGIGKINIVPQEIGRVLLNLFNNAFYAVNEKKKLQSEGYEPTVLVSTKKLNAKIEISIKDNGNGIPRKVLDKIFNPFFTTKPTGEGTGLGLSLSYDIIKTHDGEIKVETADGQGATFIIELKST